METVVIESVGLEWPLTGFGEHTLGRRSGSASAVDQRTWKEIRLRLERSERTSIEIALLRSPQWLEERNAQVGGSIFLNMPEMGLEGRAEVVAIEPCPPLERGEGRLVTGTFRHTSGEVYDLKLKAESKPLGVTATHPFWSVDRQAWVSVVELYAGETLETLTGTTQVESIRKRARREPVYNIEVERDHVYRVGESGVLVHNESAPCSANRLSPGESTIISSTKHQIRHPNPTQGPVTYKKIKKVVANLKLRSGTIPDKWMQRLIQEGVLMDLPGDVKLGLTKDHVGHIIGRQFGGAADKDNGIGNVFPQHATTNRVTFRIFETNIVAKSLEDACEICVEIEFDFAPGSDLPLRPTGFDYRWWIDGKQQATRHFGNPR